MASRTNTTLNQTANYTYDSFGNLTQVNMPNGDVYAYELDTKNRRIGKKKNGVLQVRYIYMDDLRIAAELNADLTLKRRFVYGSKSNVPDYYIEGANKFRIVSDQLGTPRVVFNMGTGAVIAKFNHDEFGVIKANTNTTLKLPFGFAGGLMDWDTGLIRFGARDYDPSLGRWLSKDPILFEGGDTNLYGYVVQDPVNWLDSDGLTRSRALPENGGGGGSGGASTNGGVSCTAHGASRAAARGITQEDITSAMSNNKGVTAGMGKYAPTVTYHGRNGVTVVISAGGRNAGSVITVYRGK